MFTGPAFFSSSAVVAGGLEVLDTFTGADTTLITAHTPDLAPSGYVWQDNPGWTTYTGRIMSNRLTSQPNQPNLFTSAPEGQEISALLVAPTSPMIDALPYKVTVVALHHILPNGGNFGIIHPITDGPTGVFLAGTSGPSVYFGIGPNKDGYPEDWVECAFARVWLDGSTDQYNAPDYEVKLEPITADVEYTFSMLVEATQVTFTFNGTPMTPITGLTMAPLGDTIIVTNMGDVSYMSSIHLEPL